MEKDNIVSIATPGWEGVEAVPPTQPEYAATEQAKIDKAIARMFGSKEGEKVMTYLVDAFLHQPCWAPGFTTDYGFFREGQNTLIRELQARVKRAKES